MTPVLPDHTSTLMRAAKTNDMRLLTPLREACLRAVANQQIESSDVLLAGDEVHTRDAIAFVSIPEGQQGKVFVEHGDGPDRMISLYVFHTNGESDFVEGIAVEEHASTKSSR